MRRSSRAHGPIRSHESQRQVTRELLYSISDIMERAILTSLKRRNWVPMRASNWTRDEDGNMYAWTGKTQHVRLRSHITQDAGDCAVEFFRFREISSFEGTCLPTDLFWPGMSLSLFAGRFLPVEVEGAHALDGPEVGRRWVGADNLKSDALASSTLA